MTHAITRPMWPDSDPAPNMPTLEEIRFAEDLRHRLELRLLNPTDSTRGFGAAQYRWANCYDD
jgi:hypothetical protein